MHVMGQRTTFNYVQTTKLEKARSNVKKPKNILTYEIHRSNIAGESRVLSAFRFILINITQMNIYQRNKTGIKLHTSRSLITYRT